MMFNLAVLGVGAIALGVLMLLTNVMGVFSDEE